MSSAQKFWLSWGVLLLPPMAKSWLCVLTCFEMKREQLNRTGQNILVDLCWSSLSCDHMEVLLYTSLYSALYITVYLTILSAKKVTLCAGCAVNTACECKRLKHANRVNAGDITRTTAKWCVARRWSLKTGFVFRAVDLFKKIQPPKSGNARILYWNYRTVVDESIALGATALNVRIMLKSHCKLVAFWWCGAICEVSAIKKHNNYVNEHENMSERTKFFLILDSGAGLKRPVYWRLEILNRWFRRGTFW